MKILYLLIVLICCSNCWAQKYQIPSDPYRLQGQKYLEDSAHVYWTSYPNPFSPLVVRDTEKGDICGDYTFFCDLSDTIGIAFVTNNDSIVYQAKIFSPTEHNFFLCYWMAGPKIQARSLPPTYFRALSDDRLSVLLIVGGREKNIREGALSVTKGWYYWIDDPSIWKR